MGKAVAVVRIPSRDTTVGGVRLWDLRVRREVAIPEGLERVGDGWFAGSEVESVVIPASVRSLGREAFCQCRSLRRVTIADESLLERIGERCFYGSGVDDIVLPAALLEIGQDAFRQCEGLRTVRVEEGCAEDVRGRAGARAGDTASV